MYEPLMGYHSQSHEWPSLYKSSIMCQGLPRTAKLHNRLPNMLQRRPPSRSRLHYLFQMGPLLHPYLNGLPSGYPALTHYLHPSTQGSKQTKSGTYANAFMVWQMHPGTSIFTCMMSYWLLESHQANSIMAYTSGSSKTISVASSSAMWMTSCLAATPIFCPQLSTLLAKFSSLVALTALLFSTLALP